MEWKASLSACSMLLIQKAVWLPRYQSLRCKCTWFLNLYLTAEAIDVAINFFPTAHVPLVSDDGASLCSLFRLMQVLEYCMTLLLCSNIVQFLIADNWKVAQQREPRRNWCAPWMWCYISGSISGAQFQWPGLSSQDPYLQPSLPAGELVSWGWVLWLLQSIINFLLPFIVCIVPFKIINAFADQKPLDYRRKVLLRLEVRSFVDHSFEVLHHKPWRRHSRKARRFWQIAFISFQVWINYLATATENLVWASPLLDYKLPHQVHQTQPKGTKPSTKAEAREPDDVFELLL